MPKEVDVVVVALTSPVLIGIYDHSSNTLLAEFQSKEKSSEYIPAIFQYILKNYTIKTLAFAKGPGSFMAIKVTYVFLKTLSISLDIKLLAQDGFYFNDNTPIKAIGKLHFIKEHSDIVTKSFDQPQPSVFSLPTTFEKENFTQDTEPLYILPAV